MELQQAESNSIEFAFQRRLEDTHAISAIRPFRPVPRSRPAFGPRLVQPGHRAAQTTPRLPAQKPSAKILQLVSPSKAQRRPASNVLPIRPKQPAKVDERLLLFMAALGPLFWLTHAALTWLHLIQ